MPNSKPYVATALICEQVLQEVDGVLTAIRIVDRFNVSPLAANIPKNILPSIELTILIMLKSGDIIGTFKAELKLRTPSGSLADTSESVEMVLKGREMGANWIARTTLPVTEYGLYWFDLYFDGSVLTSIPLRIELAQSAGAPADAN